MGLSYLVSNLPLESTIHVRIVECTSPMDHNMIPGTFNKKSLHIRAATKRRLGVGKTLARLSRFGGEESRADPFGARLWGGPKRDAGTDFLGFVFVW